MTDLDEVYKRILQGQLIPNGFPARQEEQFFYVVGLCLIEPDGHHIVTRRTEVLKPKATSRPAYHYSNATLYVTHDSCVQFSQNQSSQA